MLREAELVEGGSDEHYVVWDEAADDVAIWCPETESFATEGVKPALMGVHEVTLVDGTKKACKTALETYKDEVAVWTPRRSPRSPGLG